MQKIKFAFLVAIMALFTSAQLHAQQGDWYEDDDDEDVEEVVEVGDDGMEWDIPAGRMEEISLRLNGKDVELEESYAFSRKDILSIQVRHLKPGSRISLKVKKGGINLSKKVFYANEKGQLDLEVKTGTKKVKGGATLFYTASNGQAKEHEVKISID